MKKLLLLSVIAVSGAANAEGWNQYNMNNILSACIKKNQANPAPTINSRDFGCGCFVKEISKNLSFQDMRKTTHTKYDEYLVEQANLTCNSNYSF